MKNIDSSSDMDFENGLDMLIPDVRKRADILYKIGQELSKESDRGCALVAAAYLEKEISALLANFFVKQSKGSGVCAILDEGGL